MASANSALPKAIIIVRTTAAFHSMRHLKRAVPLRFVTVVYSSEIAIVMLSCGPSAWRTNRAGPASSAYARPARNAPTARSLYAVSRRSAWAPACAVAAPIAPSPHPMGTNSSLRIGRWARRLSQRRNVGMDETQMILALRALRELLDNGDRDKNKPMTGKDRTRVARYLREAGWGEGAIGAATAQAGVHGSSRDRIEGTRSRRVTRRACICR